jgi:hypothetical protein
MQGFKMFGSIRLVTRKQRHVMRPLYPANGILLHKPKLLNQSLQLTIAMGNMGWMSETLQMQD